MPIDVFYFGLKIIIGSVVFRIIETFMFGWNMTAQSTAEKFFDFMSDVAILVGIAVIMGWAIGVTTTLNKENNHKQ